MAEYQVTCITKTDRYSPHERISALGGPGWNWTTDEVIAKIRLRNRFWVQADRKRVYLRIDYHDGRPYVRTEPDGRYDNNLLELPSCR
jgi:hypothetical protein